MMGSIHFIHMGCHVKEPYFFSITVILLQYLQHYTKEGRKYVISMQLNICLHNIIVIDLVIIPTPRNQMNIKTVPLAFMTFCPVLSE